MGSQVSIKGHQRKWNKPSSSLIDPKGCTLYALKSTWRSQGGVQGEKAAGTGADAFIRAHGWSSLHFLGNSRMHNSNPSIWHLIISVGSALQNGQGSVSWGWTVLFTRAAGVVVSELTLACNSGGCNRLYLLPGGAGISSSPLQDSEPKAATPSEIVTFFFF